MNKSPYTGPVFSYIRFSSAKQAQGDSERRQDDAAQRWCQERNLTLDTSLRPDRGVSAYKEANLKTGNLGLFLKKIEDGTVPSGSTLLVENLDRLSRAAITSAFPLFWSIIVDHGVRVVTLMDGKEFTKESITEDPNSLYMTIGTLARGHDESKTKSIRLKSAFAKLRDGLGERKWPTNCPPWLELNPDKKSFKVIREKAKIIQRIFKDFDRGIGVFTIARNLQAEKVGRPSDGKCLWQTSNIQHYLNSRAVVGEFQPHQRTETGGRVAVGEPLKDYYPSIIDKKLFARVSMRFDRKPKTRGRRADDLVNIFRGMVRCPYCGSNMLLKRQLTKNGSRREHYICDKAQRFQTCLAVGWDRDDFECTFLEFAAQVQSEYSRVQLAKPDATELPTLQAQQRELSTQEDRLLDLYQSGKIDRDKLEQRIAAVRTEQKTLKAEVTKLENSMTGRAEEQFKLDLNTFLNTDLQNPVKRELIAGVVSRLFTKIDVYFAGLPSRQRSLMAAKKKLLADGLKGNQIFFKLAKKVPFMAERFFVGHFHDIGTKPYPDFLKDKALAEMWDDKNAHKEFKAIATAAAKR